MNEVLRNYLETSGFGQVTLGNAVMIAIGLVFIYLAVKKSFEPLLLVPIGFGMVVGNIPYLTNQLSLGVYDGPPDPTYVDRVYLPKELELRRLDGTYVRLPAGVLFPNDKFKLDRRPDGGFDPPSAIVDTSHTHAMPETFSHTTSSVGVHRPADLGAYLANPAKYDDFIQVGERLDTVTGGDVILFEMAQGRRYLVDARHSTQEQLDPDMEWPQVIAPEQLNPWNAGVLWFLYRGVKWGVYPALIFLGIGAMTDFSALLANPKLFLLGAAAQIGIFGALFMAVVLGFDMNQAASIGIIGGADGPTAIFVTAKLAPDMLGAIALAAYSYMALVPIIQPPIMKLLTSREERLVRMTRARQVSKNVKVMFPLVGFLLTAFIAPGGLVLLAMLFFGNLLKESLVTERLAKTARAAMIDIVTILLGLTVGATTTASNFLSWRTVGVFLLGAGAFAVATAGGVLAAKLMAKLSKDPINPLIGAAGVSAVPMAARVVHTVGLKEDPQNHLIEHAMGPNVAGVIGSAVAAGVLLSKLAATT